MEVTVRQEDGNPVSGPFCRTSKHNRSSQRPQTNSPCGGWGQAVLQPAYHTTIRIWFRLPRFIKVARNPRPKGFGCSLALYGLFLFVRTWENVQRIFCSNIVWMHLLGTTQDAEFSDRLR